MPEVQDNIIDLMGEKKNIEILSTIFEKSYRIKEDDDLMRKALKFSKEEKIKYFDSLRKNYRLRRELINYTAQIDASNRKIKKLLNAFRLNIVEK